MKIAVALMWVATLVLVGMVFSFARPISVGGDEEVLTRRANAGFVEVTGRATAVIE